MFGSISFRRILLSRILLLSVPVLLIGQFLTYRQVRLSLLAATHDRLVQSAEHKGEDLARFVALLRSSASVAREAAPVTAGDLEGARALFERLARETPDSVDCIWLESLATAQVLVSSCDRLLPDVPTYGSPEGSTRPDDAIAARTFFVSVAPERAGDRATERSKNPPESPSTSPSEDLQETSPADRTADPSPMPDANLETYLLLDAPVRSARDRYVLRIVSRLPPDYRSAGPADSPLSNTALIADADGTILSYPLAGYVGLNLRDLTDYERLVQMERASRAAIAQPEAFDPEMFELDDRGQQAIVGYASITDPTLTAGDAPNAGWIVLAVADPELVSRNLASVRGVMFNLVLLLLAANLTATLFLARDLALPVERLGRYARSIECNTTPEDLPSSFTIDEFNQLAAVMNASIERLKSWATELSAAWQQARQANQLKSEFLTTISHELRTPLNGIIGSLRLIRDDFCDDREEELEFLQRADDSAIHLLEIIDDILDISSIEAGTVALSPESIDLREIVREAIEVQQRDLEVKPLTLKLDLGEGDTTTIYVDPSKLRRVLVNIIGNAIKFTESGTIAVRTQVRVAQLMASFEKRPNANPVPCAAIEVRDTGIGIDPRIRDRLFEPFVMSDGSTTRQFGGTGLGLAIARNLLEMMGGRIAIDSRGTNCGTTVTIEVPLAHDACEPSPSMPAEPVESLPSVSPEREASKADVPL